jgi:DNA recombination protein RmuC
VKESLKIQEIVSSLHYIGVVYNKTMSTELVIIILSLVVSIGFWVVVRSLREELRDLKGSIDSTKNTVSASLLDTTRDIATRLERANVVIGELKKETGAFSEIGRSMKDLQEYLRSPKLRGNIGEAVLADLIAQIFPKASYVFQYTFNSGDRVDAVVKTDAGLLPIDSKFPLENFQKIFVETDTSLAATHRHAFARDVKTHVKAISSKYILPGEGTLDFALMYVPSESVYYEIVQAEEVMEFARSARVYPVSPSTLYAALQTILLSFEGKKIESRAKEVFMLLRSIQKDYEKTVGTFSTLGTHLKSAYNKYGEVENNMLTLGKKLSKTRELEDKTSNRLDA